MEEHLTACGGCRERYRKLQLADRVIAFGAEGELDQPSPVEIDRIARDLGLLDAERTAPLVVDGVVVRRCGVGGGAGGDVAVVREAERRAGRAGRAPDGVTFSAYAIDDASGPRLLEGGRERASASEHLKLRASNASAISRCGGGAGAAMDRWSTCIWRRPIRADRWRRCPARSRCPICRRER